MEKVGQEVVSYFGENGFGMKLDPLHYIVPVSHSHYYTLRSSGTYFEAGWEPFRFDNQGMVACCRKGIGQALIDSLAIVMDSGGLAVDWQAPSDLAPIGVADALMSQTHSQYRDFPAEVLDYLVRDARFKGRAGARRDNNVAGRQLFDLSHSNLVVAIDHRLPAQFPQVLGKVVNKGVIVIYYQHHFQACLPH
jgi:hypothetical protein